MVFEQFRRWWAAGGSTVTPPTSPSAAAAEPEPFDGDAPVTADAADAGAADGGAAALPEGVPPFRGPSEEQVAQAQAIWLKEDPGDGGVNIETFTCDAFRSLPQPLANPQFSAR